MTTGNDDIVRRVKHRLSICVLSALQGADAVDGLRKSEVIRRVIFHESGRDVLSFVAGSTHTVEARDAIGEALGNLSVEGNVWFKNTVWILRKASE